MSEDVRPFRVRTIAEISAELNAEDKAKAEAPRWGKWRFDPDLLVLMHDDAPWYDVDLEEFKTSAELADTIFQLLGKQWMERGDLDDFIEAVRWLLHPQATLCSFGHEQGPIDPAQVIAGRYKNALAGEGAS